jgi:hypothetical protein
VSDLSRQGGERVCELKWRGRAADGTGVRGMDSEEDEAGFKCCAGGRRGCVLV